MSDEPRSRRQSPVPCADRRTPEGAFFWEGPLSPEQQEINGDIFEILRRHIDRGGEIPVFLRELYAFAAWLAHSFSVKL